MFFYWNHNPFAPCSPLGGSQYRPTFGQQFIQKDKKKHCLCRTSFKEYSTNFLMVCMLIDFALVFLKLFMFKACIVIGISKIEFLNFSGTGRVKQNQKKLETVRHLLSLWVNPFSSNLNKFSIVFWFFLLKLYTKSKKLKNHSKPVKLISEWLSKQYQQILNIFLFFY